MPGAGLTPIERAGYLAHASRPAFGRKVEVAKDLISTTLKHAEQPYVAFSAGKDSTVCLHLARTVAPATPAVYWHDEWTLPETDELVAVTPNVRQVAATVEHAEWFTAWEGGPSTLPEGVEWVERIHADGEGLWKLGYDGAVIGIRADENSNRRKHIRAKGTLFYAAKSRQWQCYPLAGWSTADVWAYLLSRDVPYNRAYDRLGELGVPPDRQRLGPFANVRALPYGQLALLKQGWPELFERFTEQYPEAKHYT